MSPITVVILLFSMIVGKLISGVCAVALALLIYKDRT